MHRNLCPEAVVLTKLGCWKLAGFEFCVRSSDPQSPEVKWMCTQIISMQVFMIAQKLYLYVCGSCIIFVDVCVCVVGGGVVVVKYIYKMTHWIIILIWHLLKTDESYRVWNINKRFSSFLCKFCAYCFQTVLLFYVPERSHAKHHPFRHIFERNNCCCFFVSLVFFLPWWTV